MFGSSVALRSRWRRRAAGVTAGAVLAGSVAVAVAFDPAAAEGDPSDIRITEWMYSGAGGEFVELTNVGEDAVSVAGWSYDDDSRDPGVFDLSPFGTIQPGESVVFAETTPDEFRVTWGLCAGAKVIGPYDNNIGRNDEINIYDGADEIVDRLTYGDGDIPGTIRTNGASGWVSDAGLGANDPAEWTLSTVGDAESSYEGDGGAVASPGTSTRASVEFDACEANAPVLELDPGIVIGAVGDPTNPPAELSVAGDGPDATEIDVAVTDADVLPAENVTIEGAGANRMVSFEPVGRGTTAVTFTAVGPDGPVGELTITYAASAATPHDSGRYHHQVSDASAAIDVGDGYMLVLNDETNTVFLHRHDLSGPPVEMWSFSPDDLGTTSEIDFEAIARRGNLLILAGSHGNNRSGEIRTERRTLVAATIEGVGADTELSFQGRYDDLWSDLRAWDRYDAHGLGPDALGMVAASAPGVLPNAPDGLNIEGAEFGPDGDTLYLGFRAPTVEVDGTRHAVIVTMDRVDEIVGGVPGSGPAWLDDVILLDLDGRSIRALASNDSGGYLISAGPTPQNETWAMYTWDGDPEATPRLNRILPDPDPATGGVWEAIGSMPGQLEQGAEVRLVTDSGDTDFYGTGQTKDLAPALQKSYSQVFELTAGVPLTRDECSRNGWQSFSRPDGTPFRNQGDCVRYLRTGV